MNTLMLLNTLYKEAFHERPNATLLNTRVQKYP